MTSPSIRLAKLVVKTVIIHELSWNTQELAYEVSIRDAVKTLAADEYEQETVYNLLKFSWNDAIEEAIRALVGDSSMTIKSMMAFAEKLEL